MCEKQEFRFCWCGLPHPEGGHKFACKRHKDSEPPKKREPQRKMSGDSTYRQENGQFQAKWK